MTAAADRTGPSDPVPATAGLDLPTVGGCTLTSIDLPHDPENWHRRFVTFWLDLRRLLPLLAVLSLALTPVTASAAAAGTHASMTAQVHGSHDAMLAMDHAGMDVAGMDMDDMPCCPPEKAAKPDCTKADCPLMALCLASVASLLPVAVLVPAPVATRTSRAWPAAASFASLHGPPLPEPPRA